MLSTAVSIAVVACVLLIHAAAMRSTRSASIHLLLEQDSLSVADAGMGVKRRCDGILLAAIFTRVDGCQQ